MPKSKAKPQEVSLGTINSTFTMQQSSGTVVATTIAPEDIGLIKRYRNSSPFADLKTFVRHSVKDSVSWMRRMINGSAMFELETMDYWTYLESEDVLVLKNPGRTLRDHHVIFDMSFCRGNIDEFFAGQGLVLSSVWYKTTSLPLTMVELIASMDILYRLHHNDRSPASDTGIPRVSLSDRSIELND